MSAQETLATYELHDQPLSHWLEYLTTDQRTGEPSGHLVVPCSRYGRTAKDVAPWAVACEVIFITANGPDASDDPHDSLDWYMSLVVNDDPDPAEMVRDYGFVLPAPLTQLMDIEYVLEFDS